MPSNYGIFCVDVSPLCADYDSITGDCLSCKNAGYAVREGKCLQINSPLAGCAEREALGFGECVGADVFCNTFDLISGDCEECNSGYYLDYSGHCVKEAVCGAGQVSINGECLSLPENCVKANKLGLCSACATPDFRVIQGQCVYFKRCADRQYLNTFGQCVDVSPQCDRFNPSNGQCITCKTPGTHPSQGVCCPPGNIYSNGKCVSSNAYQQSYQSASGPSCLIRHPSINVCLRCAVGYSADYTIPFGCALNL